MKRTLFIFALFFVLPSLGFAQKNMMSMAKLNAELFIDRLMAQDKDGAIEMISERAIGGQKTAWEAGLLQIIAKGFDTYDLSDEYYFKDGDLGKGHYYHIFFDVMNNDKTSFIRIALFNTDVDLVPTVVGLLYDEDLTKLYVGSKKMKF